jgi:putative hemolysin
MIRAMTAALETAGSLPPAGAPDHIVDVLIKERAPGLSRSPAWPLLRPLLYAMLGYRQARMVADAIAGMGGPEALAYASALLRLEVAAHGLERVPATGRLIVIVNHPTGLADGVAVDDVLRPIRPEICYFANADALRVSPRLGEVFIPVEWVEAKRTRERTRLTVKLAQDALEAERAIVIFPAGRIARKRGAVLADPAWAPSALSLARRHGAPILPVHLAGPPSTLFRLFDRFSGELRDVTLFHELFNKRGGRFAVTVGPLIPPEAIGDPAADTLRLKAYVEQVLPNAPDQAFA